MERIVKSQTLGQTDSSSSMLNKRVLEINPVHPIIKKMKNINDTEEYNSMRDLLDLVINSALLYSGYQIIKPVDFSKKVLNVVMVGLDIEEGVEEEEPKQGNTFDNVETIDMTSMD